MSQADVLEDLGEPDDVILRGRAATPRAFCYGVFELYFDSERHYALAAIHADNFEMLTAGPNVAVDAWILRRGVELKAVEAALRDQQIGVASVRPPDPRLRGLRTQSGVELWFDDDGSETKRGLRVVFLALPYEANDREKQISVSIPMADYEKIRREAQRQHVSIAKLCRRWLLEQVARHPTNDA